MPRETFEHEYPPADWRADEIADALREAPAEYPLPRYEDAEVFERLAGDDLTGPVVERSLEQAAEERGEPVPRLPASLYLDYRRTGNRTRYQEKANARTSRLSAFALAECFEREGEYLDDVLDYAWAICEQSTWLLPAHLGQNDAQDVSGLPGVVPDVERHVALRSAGTAQQLAELDYVLGDQLHPALRDRIREEIDRRVLTPYESRDDFWWFPPPTNNWNAVCNAGTVIAALHVLDDPDRQARIIEKAARSLEGYLADFDEDGCTAEGIGYWNYGFGNYVQLAAHLEARLDGEFSLLSPPIIEEIARYPLKVEMSPGHFIPFSDASEESRVDPFTACWLGTQLDLPGLAARGRREFEGSGSPGDLGDTLRQLQWVREVPADWTTPTPPERIYFTGYEWWLGRVDPTDPGGLVVAAKDGHNDESHNHNDLGSFVFHVGQESLLTDLGSPVYDADFFSDRRYEYLVARSLGHNVPYVNGTEQAPGGEHAASVTDRSSGPERESFAVELADAYPEGAGLESLERTLVLERAGDGRLRVEDEARFSDADNDLEEVFVSYFQIDATDDGFEVTGEKRTAIVEANPAPEDVSVERLEEAVRGEDVWRVRLSYPVTGEAVDVGLTVTPSSA